MAELEVRADEKVVVPEDGEPVNFSLPHPNGSGDVAYSYAPGEEIPRELAEQAGLLKVRGKAKASAGEEGSEGGATETSEYPARTAKKPGPRGT